MSIAGQLSGPADASGVMRTKASPSKGEHMASIAGLNETTLSSSFGNTTTNSTGTTNSTTNTTNSTGTTTTTAQTTSQTTQQDTVKLSPKAQAKSLYHQGESVATIASSLGTTSKQIDDYLGITLQKELQQTLQATEKAG